MKGVFTVLGVMMTVVVGSCMIMYFQANQQIRAMEQASNTIQEQAEHDVLMREAEAALRKSREVMDQFEEVKSK